MVYGLESKDIITFVIALYGAGLSTFNLFDSLKKEKRRIVVSCEPTFYAYPDGNVGTQQTSIKIANHGQRAVVVNAPKLRMPNGKFMFLAGADGAKKFPKRLEDGDSVSLTIPDSEISKTLVRAGYSGNVKLRPQCTDQTERRYRGKALMFTVKPEG
jgi:hypothetical protein